MSKNKKGFGKFVAENYKPFLMALVSALVVVFVLIVIK